MAIKSDPYHSIESSDPDVHHVFADCPNGLQIIGDNRRPGTSNWPMCGTCKNMSSNCPDRRSSPIR